MQARLGLAVGTALTAGTAGAEKPLVRACLAECSAAFRSVALQDGYAKVTADEIAAANKAALRFRGRAVEVAGELGQQDPKADLVSIIPYLGPRWENRIERLFSVKSNLDWLGYCGRLGREHGVMTPDFSP